MIINAQNVSKVFREGASEVRALSGVTLDIAEGEFTALSGPSGSGKSTLLNLIGCLDRPSSGKIFFENEPVSEFSECRLTQFRLRKLGFIFQDYNLIPTFTAAENIEYVLWLGGVAAAERRKRSAEVCERFGIGKLLKRYPNQMSRGQQQRVAVARAIVHRPRLVLGDELTANLDHKTALELMTFLKELSRQSKITFLFATHDPAILEFADRVIRLLDGKVE